MRLLRSQRQWCEVGPDAGAAPSMGYPERLAEAGIEPSVGSKDDSCDNALAETVNGLYKAQVIHRQSRWKTTEAVELATLAGVSWFNQQRLMEPPGYIPLAEAEKNYDERQSSMQSAAMTSTGDTPQNPGRFSPPSHPSSMTDTLNGLAQQLELFANERDWQQFHSPKNLAAALTVEAGELLEHFQWLTEEQSRTLTPEKRDAVGAEIADVLLYLIQLSSSLGIDPVAAAQAKLQLNAVKYPVDRARGSSKKYDELWATRPGEHLPSQQEPVPAPRAA